MTCIIFYVQAGQSSTVIENIHTIIAAAAVKFNFDQLSHLFVLIQKVLSIILWTLSSLWAVSDCDCVVSELGGGEWSRETEASESDWTDRQGGSLWGNHRKSMCRSYVYMKLYFCPSTKTELKVGLWTRQAVISYNAEMWQPVIDVERLKLVKACTVIIIILFMK